MYNQLLHVYTFVIFICILIIYIADHRFIPAVSLCSADRFFIKINDDIIFSYRQVLFGIRPKANVELYQRFRT